MEPSYSLSPKQWGVTRRISTILSCTVYVVHWDFWVIKTLIQFGARYYFQNNQYQLCSINFTKKETITLFYFSLCPITLYKEMDYYFTEVLFKNIILLFFLNGEIVPMSSFDSFLKDSIQNLHLKYILMDLSFKSKTDV